MDKTLLIIKPDAVQSNNIGAILTIIENNGFEIVDIKKLTLTEEQANLFYQIHKDKSFFNNLITFVTSNPVVPVLLKRENAVKKLREIVGATDPLKAEKGTIRNLFGTNVTINAVHASDSDENADIEINFFFK